MTPKEQLQRICPGQAHHLSGRDTIKEWAPFLNFVLPFSVGRARGYLSLPRTLPAAGIRCREKKGHGSLVSSSFTLVALTYICLHLLCIPRASVCSSSVCRAGFRGFWTQGTAALSLSCRLAFFSTWARTFHGDHGS